VFVTFTGQSHYHCFPQQQEESKGFGAYASWEVGGRVQNFYEFFGGGPIDRCAHNGCDASGVWRLHISGSGSCAEHYEYVHGAYFSGVRSVRYIAAEMAGKGDDIGLYFQCDDFFRQYEIPMENECPDPTPAPTAAPSPSPTGAPSAMPTVPGCGLGCFLVNYLGNLVHAAICILTIGLICL